MTLARHASRSLQASFAARLEHAPDRRALAFLDASGTCSWRTMEALWRDAASEAAALRELGLQRRDVCVLVLPSGELCATLLTAVLLSGAVPLLVASPVVRGQHTSLFDILARVIRKTRPRLVIATPEFVRDSAAMLGSMPTGTRLVGWPAATAAAASEGFPVIADGDDLAALQLTSGTTAFPRICMWNHRGILAAIDGMSQSMAITEHDICLNWTPLYHDMGLVNNFLSCLVTGVPLVMMSPIDFVKRPFTWLRGLSTTGATVTWSPNFGFALAAQRVTDAELAGIRLDHVRAFWNAAERIHFETFAAFYERFRTVGVRLDSLKTNFGCAENVGGATFSDPHGPIVVEHVDRRKLHGSGIAAPVRVEEDATDVVSVVGVGRASPGVRVRILSKSGRDLQDGRVGELALDTPSRMLGYLGNARATTRALGVGVLRTGDLGYRRGEEIFWVGRVRERLTVRGRKLDPSDFEAVLLQVSGLRSGCFAVFGVDDAGRGTQKVVILAEIRDGAASDAAAIAAEIRNRVFQRLGVRVDDVQLVPANTLTKTSSGKRRHRYFRNWYIKGQPGRFDNAEGAKS